MKLFNWSKHGLATTSIKSLIVKNVVFPASKNKTVCGEASLHYARILFKLLVRYSKTDITIRGKLPMALFFKSYKNITKLWGKFPFCCWNRSSVLVIKLYMYTIHVSMNMSFLTEFFFVVFLSYRSLIFLNRSVR